MQFQLDDVCKSMKNLELTMVPSMRKLNKQHGHVQHVEDNLTDKTYQLEQKSCSTGAVCACANYWTM